MKSGPAEHWLSLCQICDRLQRIPGHSGTLPRMRPSGSLPDARCPNGPGPVQSVPAKHHLGATVVVGWAPTPPPPARRHGQRRRSDKEADMVVSWTVVSWIGYGVAGLALVVLALLGIEVALFLLAAAFMY
jgi:hypothetical protein